MRALIVHLDQGPGPSRIMSHINGVIMTCIGIGPSNIRYTSVPGRVMPEGNHWVSRLIEDSTRHS